MERKRLFIADFLIINVALFILFPMFGNIGKDKNASDKFDAGT